ncbi:MAG: site-specific integrase [Acidobacteriota bacterium]
MIALERWTRRARTDAPMMSRRKAAETNLSLLRRWRRTRCLRPLLVGGMMGDRADDFVVFLIRSGYAWLSVEVVVRCVRRFLRHAQRARGIRQLGDLTDELAERYASGEPRGRRRMDRRRSVRLLMVFLRDSGVLPASETPAARRLPVVEEYVSFQVDQRGTSLATTHRNRRYVEELLAAVGKTDVVHMESLDGGGIQQFVMARAKALTPSLRKELCGALRTFLRFLVVRGYTTRDLTAAVPVIPTYRLARLPRAISSDATARILAGIDRSTPTGLRDYAILVLLATYGMRSGQLLALRLDDIDWRHQQIRVAGAKGGRDVVLPLHPAVGEAIVDYLRRGRPVGWSFRQVFLSAQAPVRPLRRGASNIIRLRAAQAEVDLPCYGAHAWRHACATRWLAGGRSLKDIRHMLGHSSIETTFIYTKVDLGTLRKVAMEWPEDVTA